MTSCALWSSNIDLILKSLLVLVEVLFLNGPVLISRFWSYFHRCLIISSTDCMSQF